MEFITKIDLLIMEWIQANLQSEWMTLIMKIITRIGDVMLLWAIILVVYFLFKKNNKRAKLVALSLLLSVVVSELILKNIVRRPRPFIENAHLQSLIHKPNNYSFPSSHSATSFSVATSLTKINKWVTLGSYTLATLIAFSRVYLNVHHPSDVIVGAVVGILASKIAGYLIQRFDK
ncbi:phosphatase PAP2 family protein [Anaerorhabdus sp.]|jgi:undecaprenyl-diphosphatase|uniref:phosphatase PAP2 family protein n=1 Tax=Anaerorhabdus sp. TaxID=1872524 RepID=UPI002FC8EA50